MGKFHKVLKHRMSLFIGGRFRLREKIGNGSFGEIHKGDDVKTSLPVAIKIEKSDCQVPQLENESKTYIALSGGVNIPRHHYFGTEPTYKAMIIDLESTSLEDTLKNNDGKLSLKTVLMLADQMLTSIEFIHRKGYIHRDVKPDNFMFGTKKKDNQLFIIDFGLAKRYLNLDGTHIKYREHTSLTGTARYASINSLRGVEQSRRDDMESLAYIFIYLLRGNLPWMNVQAATVQGKYDKICAIKKSTSPQDLCAGYPKEFADFLMMTKRLKFEEQPEYSKYRKMFRDLFLKQGFCYDYKYDWVKYEPKVWSIKKPKKLLLNQRTPSKPTIIFKKSDNNNPIKPHECTENNSIEFQSPHLTLSNRSIPIPNNHKPNHASQNEQFEEEKNIDIHQNHREIPQLKNVDAMIPPSPKTLNSTNGIQTRKRADSLLVQNSNVNLKNTHQNGIKKIVTSAISINDKNDQPNETSKYRNTKACTLPKKREIASRSSSSTAGKNISLNKGLTQHNLPESPRRHARKLTSS